MTNSNPPFSFKSPDYYEQLQIELAGMASDLRMLGFNEKTIQSWIKKIWDLEKRKALKLLIENLKVLQSEYEESEERQLAIKKRAKRFIK